MLEGSLLDPRLRPVRKDSDIACFSFLFLLSWRSMRSACHDTDRVTDASDLFFSNDHIVRSPCASVTAEKAVCRFDSRRVARLIHHRNTGGRGGVSTYRSWFDRMHKYVLFAALSMTGIERAV